jgi:MoaA/NifB/PqqE/SkfB family radical SAM enzyme/SAM-dependent methyltransferase
MKGEDFFVEIASHPSLSRLHPRVGQLLKEYLAGEKAVRFGDQWVINAHMPPYPGRAFDRMAGNLLGLQKRLYSVTLAVTNRCCFDCWHCYNAGRSQKDLPLATLVSLVSDLQQRGVVMVTLTGGEPLLRADLEQICGAFDDRSTVILGTTGWGLTAERAHGLKDAGVFGVGISLDSDRPAEHDAKRGRDGAFGAALDALATAGGAGLYPYVVTVADAQMLRPERFIPFMEFAGRRGAVEVHLLEPSATGKLAGRTDAMLTDAHRQIILDYQRQVAAREDLPVLSTFTYLESPDSFGCGAGLTHIYVDGSGELCPCNLVPMSFGNVASEPLDAILDRMGRHFCQPRCRCAGRTLSPHIPEGHLPTDPATSATLCEEHLPGQHELPAIYRAVAESPAQAGLAELREAYDRVHGDYDDFWVVQAGQPVADLVARLKLRGNERVFEAGCGSGFGSALLAQRLDNGGSLLAVDLSEGMISQARRRLAQRNLVSPGQAGASQAARRPANVTLQHGDALDALRRQHDLDVVFTSWVLGYIPLGPFFAAAEAALARGGCLAFVVHRDNSPREPLDIFAKLVARNPGALRKRVAFDFPAGAAEIRDALGQAGLQAQSLWEGSVVFTYDSPQEVLDHLLKSGAGTVFHDALDPLMRPELERAFIEELAARHGGAATFQVIHDFAACIAQKP